MTSSLAITTQEATETAPVAAPGPVASLNAIQAAAANPRSVADDIYLAIIALFVVALAINIFVKIRIQHPQAIVAGMLVILVAGLLIVLNQHALVGTVIL